MDHSFLISIKCGKMKSGPFFFRIGLSIGKKHVYDYNSSVCERGFVAHLFQLVVGLFFPKNVGKKTARYFKYEFQSTLVIPGIPPDRHPIGKSHVPSPN